MRYAYDRETDILSIVLSDDPPDFGEQTESFIAHYGADGKPVEIEGPGGNGPESERAKLVQIEILDASSTGARPHPAHPGETQGRSHGMTARRSPSPGLPCSDHSWDD